MVSIELNTSKEEIEASHEVMTRLKLESDKVQTGCVALRLIALDYYNV